MRWASQSGFDINDLNKGDEPPWMTTEAGDYMAADKRQIEGAALSPDGRRIVWIERLRTIDHSDVVSGIPDPERQKTVSLIGSMVIGKDIPDPRIAQDGFALAVAIDNAGHIAHVQASSSGSGHAILKFSADQRVLPFDPQDGRAKCLGFSPNGQYLVFGTEGGALRRVAVDAPATKPIVLSRNKDEIKEGRGKVGITTCAVADDGAVVAGYGDGEVLYFPAKGTVVQLTARAVYGFPAPVKEVRLDPPLVTALGEWQINNCIHPGLPGQSTARLGHNVAGAPAWHSRRGRLFPK